MIKSFKMFWRKEQSRKPALTGTGEFVWNVDWWLWDDRASPGLISIERFSDLARTVLPEKDHKQFSLALVSSSISGSSQSVLKSHFKIMSDYLADLRVKDFDQLTNWLESNFIASPRNSVTRNSSGAIEYNLIRVLMAYLNCLNKWSFGYDCKEICDHDGAVALLVLKHREPRYCLNGKQIQYVQGKPYRFEVMFKSGVRWKFEDRPGNFAMHVPGHADEMRF